MSIGLAFFVRRTTTTTKTTGTTTTTTMRQRQPKQPQLPEETPPRRRQRETTEDANVHDDVQDDEYDYVRDRYYSDFVAEIPKVELHAHLNGCVRESTLRQLADERGFRLEEEYHYFRKTTKPTQTESQTSSTSLFYNSKPRSLRDCFELFDGVLPRCIDSLPVLKRVAHEALEDFAYEDSVAYLELRSTPKRLLLLPPSSSRRRSSSTTTCGHDDNNNNKNDEEEDDDLVGDGGGGRTRRYATKRQYVETVLEAIREFERSDLERYRREITTTTTKQVKVEDAAPPPYDDNNNNSEESSASATSTSTQREQKQQRQYRQPVALPRLPLRCRFIVAIDRSRSFEEAKENVDLAIELFRKEEQESQQHQSTRAVVGIDLGGNPTVGRFRDFRPLLEKARAAGLRVTVHCGEVPCTGGASTNRSDPSGGSISSDDDDDDDTDDTDELRTREYYQEVVDILDFRPDRLGHALLLPPKLRRRVRELQIPIETCPTSNVMTLELNKMADNHGDLLHGLRHHPNLEYWLSIKKEEQDDDDQLHQLQQPLAVGTDDPGVFDTTLTRELLLIMRAFRLEPRRVAELAVRSLDYAFVVGDGDDDAAGIETKRLMEERVEHLLARLDEEVIRGSDPASEPSQPFRNNS